FRGGRTARGKKLRVALGDSGSSSRYIETLPRRGYRFIVPVHRVPAPDRPVPLPRRSRAWSRFARHRCAVIAAPTLVVMVAGALLIATRRPPLDDRRIGPPGRGLDSVNADAN